MAKSEDKSDGNTPTKRNTKIDGQCAAPDCQSTRIPNGEKYLCPVHADSKKN